MCQNKYIFVGFFKKLRLPVDHNEPESHYKIPYTVYPYCPLLNRAFTNVVIYTSTFPFSDKTTEMGKMIAEGITQEQNKNMEHNDRDRRCEKKETARKYGQPSESFEETQRLIPSTWKSTRL